jgi:hypothetical protein
VLDTKSPKHLEMVQGHISLSLWSYYKFEPCTIGILHGTCKVEHEISPGADPQGVRVGPGTP